LEPLHLPDYPLRIEIREGKRKVFDPLRRKWVLLTPEEHVRQLFVQFLVREKNFPEGLIAIEKGFRHRELYRRSDILVYGRNGEPLLIVECKAPGVKITEQVFDQIAMYNMKFGLSYLVITNGMEHYACSMDFKEKKYVFLRSLPGYEEL
jgi:hypothetical protein